VRLVHHRPLIAVTSLDVAIRQIAHVGSDKLKEIESSPFSPR
jgi:hypothetical protein